MTHSSLLSPDNHTRHSHYLPTSSQAGNGISNGGFKASLRKIPSTFFQKSPAKEKQTGKAQLIGGAPQSRLMNMSPSIKKVAKSSDIKDATKSKLKSKNKPRKALAELFGWSNHSHSQSNRPPPPPKDLVPVPVLAQKETTMLRKPNRPPSTKFNSSHFVSLRPPQETVLPSRPSMGDDPFMRPEEGAEVVDTVLRHGTPSIRSQIPLDRRSSISSSKALSCKTSLSEERYSQDTKERNSYVPTVRTAQQDRRVSAPIPQQPAVKLPPGSASLGKALGSSCQTFIPLPELPEAAAVAVPVTVVEPPKKTLKKEKTKSKVWGLLGRSKSKKNKTPIEESAPPMPLVKDIWSKPAAPVRSSASLMNTIDKKYAASTDRSNYSFMRTTTRVPPPSLHISQPSNDIGNTGPRSALTLAGSIDSAEDLLDSPKGYPTTCSGGVRETVIGSIADRPSTDGPRQAIEALMGPTRLPKRKSLTGLFSLHSRKSIAKLKPASPTQGPSSPPRIVGQPNLKSLAEEIEEYTEEVKPTRTTSSSDVFSHHWGTVGHLPMYGKDVVRKEAGLRRVASATDKLLNLVHLFDFSPASNSPTLRVMSSSNSLRQNLNDSPTPLRKVRSAMLVNQSSVSSLKPPSANVSPLKLALQRSQFNVHQNTSLATPGPTALNSHSPPRQSMVRKGMRNIFAPPSPAVPERAMASVPSVALSVPKTADESVRALQPTRLIKGSETTDVPFDLKPMVLHTEAAKAGFSPNRTAKLGLPAAPPQGRITPRRPGPAPPALSLPPVPDEGPAHISYIDSLTPAVEVDDTIVYNVRDSMFSDRLAVERNDFRDSFDFTNEFQALDQGNQRASFVEALKKVSSVQMFMDLPPVPSMPLEAQSAPDAVEKVPSFHISKPSDGTNDDDDDNDSVDEDNDDGEFGDDEAFEDAVEIHHVMGIAKTSPVRREPFKGQVAFQQQMSMRQQPSHSSFGAPDPVLHADLSSLPAAPHSIDYQQQGHRRGQSSVATMSSIGSVIGNARDYTNYFDYTVPQPEVQPGRAPMADGAEEAGRDSGSPSRRSMESFTFGAKLNAPHCSARPTTRRGHHHRRNSSIQSVDSVGGIDMSALINNGPPVSMHNSRRSRYISKHRRNASTDSSFGRPDWAAHRRNSSSVASTASNVSVSQIIRPGLGDRMFQSDGGVQLASISGSPPDESSKASSTAHQRTASWDSLFDDNCSRMFRDSIFDGSHSKVVDDSLFDNSHARDSYLSTSSESWKPSSDASDADSLFGPEQQYIKKEFVLRGLRPLSTVSTDTNASLMDDTFSETNPGNVSKKVQEYERCLQGEGEDMSNMTPLGKKVIDSAIIGRQMLGSYMSRPAKPGRRRPPQLVFNDVPVDTPGLTSPSASETSSRLSLDTNAASFTLGTRARGHCRQASSAQVNIDATIHEMPSLATLRPKPSFNSPCRSVDVISQHEPTIIGVDALEFDDEVDKLNSVRDWVKWEREAMDEFRKTKNVWADSEESKMAISDWDMPQTTAEIVAFLAQSSKAYKPLEQLPVGRVAHRRKSSLGEARSLCSPYGLPLPKSAPINKPKMSLTTKYEKKSSTSSKASTTPSAFSFAFFPDDVPEAPASAPAFVSSSLSNVFAPIAQITTPASPPPSLAAFKPSSPFHLPVLDHFGLRKHMDNNMPKEKDKDKQPVREEEDIATKRKRVDSKARRQALGWGRRRNSDGPDKVVNIGAAARKDTAPRVLAAKPSQLKNKSSGISVKVKETKDKKKEPVYKDVNTSRSIFKGQENIIGRPQPLRPRGDRSPVKRKPAPRYVASQPVGLRA